MTVKSTEPPQKAAGLAQFQRAPLTRAIRQTLAISVATVALAGTAPVFAAACTAPVGGVVNCPGDASDPDYPAGIVQVVDDLFLTIGGPGDTPTVTGVGFGVFATDDGFGTGTASVVSYADITATGTFLAEGIHTAAPDDVAATNHGVISATATNGVGSALARGVHAYAYAPYGDVAVTNTGTVTAAATAAGALASAYGVYAGSTFGDVAVTNSGTVSATADATAGYDASATGVDAYSILGNVAVDNSGAIAATATAFDDASAYGVYAGSFTGDVTVTNSGSIAATATAGANSDDADAYGVSAYSTYGDVAVTNSGSIAASATSDLDDADAYGVYAYSAYGDVAVTNGGTVSASAVAYDNARAYGISASSFAGDVTVVNSGTVSATATGSEATGIYAASTFGDVTLDNSGTASATATGIADGAFATGVYAAVFAGAGDVTLNNSGSVSASATTAAGEYYAAGAAGIYVYSYNDIDITNDGTVSATASNTGPLTAPYASASAYAAGIYAYAYNFDANVINRGTVTATATSTNGFAGAYGILAYSNLNDVSVAVEDYAVVSATATGGLAANATGIGAYAYDDVDISNAGSVSATANGGLYSIATGVLAYGRDTLVSNSGDISAAATGGDGAVATVATGIGAFGYESNEVTNSGDISATAASGAGSLITAATGIGAVSGDALEIYNSGTIGAYATAGDGSSYGVATGVVGASLDSDGVSVSNAEYGAITAVSTVGDGNTGAAAATGVVILGADHAEVSNAGAITATSTVGDLTAPRAPGDLGISAATGVAVFGYDLAEVSNSGDITATATAGDGGYAYAVGIAAAGNSVNVTNAGDVTADASAGAGGTASSYGVAIYAATDSTVINTGTITGDVAIASFGASADYIYNGGTINGAIYTGYGDDALVNNSADTWNATGVSSFGAGDDTITNTAMGRIVMTDAVIDMGGYTAAGNMFDNAGLIEAFGSNTINMGAGNPNPLMNTGTISFIDGDTSDSLNIMGNLSGAGAVNVDVDGATATADALTITGDVVGGPTTVNAALTSLPADLNVGFEVPVVYVTGTSAPGDFVLGDLWVAPDSFLTFDAGILSSVDATNVTPDVHSIGVMVSGLSDVGVLASSLSPAVQTLFQTAVGTLHQRQGAVRDQLLERFSVWVRGFGSKGNMDPDGIQPNIDFDQEIQGFEAGFDFALQSDLRIGILAGQANTDIDLGSHRGKADIDGDTLGAYLTWMAQNGFYADLSYRVMDLEGDIKNAGAKMDVDGDAKGWSLETGYTMKTADGVEVEPQFQFSTMEVELDDIANSYGKFELDDGDSTTARLGVMLRKTYTTGNGVRWTPYLSLNAIREFEGENDYSINNTFEGKSDIGGTSYMVEHGLNVQMGHVIIYAGLNYQDAGAFDEVLGGQLGVRYQW